jgi:hypothetical protein
MKPQTKNLQKIAKKILNKETLKKINSLENEHDLAETLKFSIISELKIRHHNLEMQIKELEKENKHIFYAGIKSARVPAKIKHFAVEFSNEEFYKLSTLLNDIKKEIENARSV